MVFKWLRENIRGLSQMRHQLQDRGFFRAKLVSRRIIRGLSPIVIEDIDGQVEAGVTGVADAAVLVGKDGGLPFLKLGERV